MKVIQTTFKYANELVPLNIEEVKYILIHHAAAVTATPEQIHQWHLANNWSGFGYNEYIRKDGTVYIGRGDHKGAQCTGMNSKSYGICCEGNYDTETSMPAEQYKSLLERINVNKLRFINLVSVEPHSKFFDTSCPGSKFPMAKLLDALKTKGKTNNTSSSSSIPNLKDDIAVLFKNGIIQMPEYWLEYAAPGKMVKGENIAALLHNFADKLRED